MTYGGETERHLVGSRILVIGGAGFIGSHIVDQLLADAEGVASITVLDNLTRGTRANLAAALEDPRVLLLEGSILDRECLADATKGVDYVFHLAALWLFECVHEPRAAIEVNALGTFNVIEAAQEAGVKKIVYSSSASVYGDALVTPMNEDHPFNNRTMYGATKIASEQFLRALAEQHGLNYVALRYMNVYGPRMDYKGAYVSVIMKVLDRIEIGQPPVIFGDGLQTYDFVHVADVARANILALKTPTTDRSYNVGRGTGTTIRELVDALLKISGSTLEPELRPDEKMFVTHRVGSTQAAAADLGFQAEIAIEPGLRSVVAWRRSQERRPVASQVAIPTAPSHPG